MSASQMFPNQPAASSSNPGGSRPRIIFKFPPAVQPMLAIPLSNALPSVPSAAKKMQRMAFEHSLLLMYPSVPVSGSTPSSLPSNIQSIYDDAYLANSSPEVLEQFHILVKLPLVVTYCFVLSCGNFVSRDEEWAALTTGLCDYPYYRKHPEELGLASEKLRVQEGKRKAVVSSNAFQKSQLLQQERVCLGEPSRKPVILAPSCKGKEVVRDPVDNDVEMEVPDAMDSMDLDYLEDVSLAPVPIPAAPAPVLMKPAVIWQADNRQSYHEVSGLKIWFFEPLIKPVPSNSSNLSQDEMIRTAIECVVTRIAELLSGPGKKMLEQDLWALADGMVQGIFNELEEQLNHPSSEPPAPFLNSGLTQFIESLSMINLSSANIEQVVSRDLQLKDKDEELTRLKSFVRRFTGDVQLTEVQQLREAMEAQDGEMEELKKKLAASEEARRVAAEESKLQDEELAQLWQLFESV
ncbi:hypothetical protein GYMLUDRAFT_252042 [Collybiopsis luxurians FD-317 M1]|uniref:Unplaced genomic scaffold GYMLUscaffold_114, whole genome shotgun sequence n=1 Tax=Collybiopsis luxurians FD-317 M1 TaxID=944289 RepID=A0A0D0C1E4_9AGAR|nr:hypothetical protein GYMLUDRAFT_252042 [Collybiopsis luxurians FD-317 M1]